MKAPLSAVAVPVSLLLLGSAVASPPPLYRPVTFTIESTVPGRPVRFTVVGSATSVTIAAASLRTVADTMIAATPAHLTVGDSPVRVEISVETGEPGLLVSYSDHGRLEAWANRLELKRDSAGGPLRVLSPALRWAAH